jgi:putative addiction module component (TIGR02574 family)
MTAQSRSLLDAALALNNQERVWLAEQLLESVGPDDGAPAEELDRLDDEAFAAEIERRYNEVREGKAELIPWSEVQEKE